MNIKHSMAEYIGYAVENHEVNVKDLQERGRARAHEIADEVIAGRMEGAVEELMAAVDLYDEAVAVGFMAYTRNHYEKAMDLYIEVMAWMAVLKHTPGQPFAQALVEAMAYTQVPVSPVLKEVFGR